MKARFHKTEGGADNSGLAFEHVRDQPIGKRMFFVEHPDHFVLF